MNQIEAPWAKIPQAVIKDNRLVRADLLVYWYLDYRCGKSGKWFGGQKEIAQAIGIGIRSVERAVTKLTEYGYVAKHRQGMQRLTHNLYYVLARTVDVPLSSKRSVTDGGSVPSQMADAETQTTDTEDDDTPKIKPSEVFAALQSTEGPIYVDVSHPQNYDKGFHGDLSAFNAEELNAYVSKMDAVRRRHARYVSQIDPLADLAPLLIRPRDLRVLFSLAHKTCDWTVTDLWDSMKWGGVSADGHNILKLVAERG